MCTMSVQCSTFVVIWRIQKYSYVGTDIMPNNNIVIIINVLWEC